METTLRDEIVRDPIYCQVNDLLRAMLSSPEFPVGARFLTERQISERFQISRATANKALSVLVAEGLLTFRKGIGTFVAESRLESDLRSLVSFTEKARAAGKAPSTRVLQFALLEAPEAGSVIGAALQIKATESIYQMVRLRLADESPVILEERYLVARYCADLSETQLAGSLYELLGEQYKLDIVGAEETIRAVSLDAEESQLLITEPGAAGLLVTAVGYLSGGVPLWYERTLYRGDAYEFRNRLGPLIPARPALGALL